MAPKKKKKDIEPEIAQSAVVKDLEKLSSQEGDLNAAKSVIIDQNVLNDELQKELRRFLIPKLRTASYRWYYRSEAIKAARIDRGVYECAMCKARLKNGEFKVDHKDPVVPLDGWDGKDWTIYINRMFCDTKGFQILCDPCHTVKTDTEVQLRKMRREAKKKLDK